MIEEIFQTFFVLGVSGIAFIGLVFGLAETLGRIYGTFRCLVRKDLTSEQRIIYLMLIWFIPLGWLIYFILGTEKSQELFAEVEIF